MRYIRTKTGIYENTSPYFVKDNKLYRAWLYRNDTGADLLGEIIKQSDKLEEICDGFYLDTYSKFNSDFIYDKAEYCRFQNDYKLYNGSKKGRAFILIDGGLIFVAEMTNEGLVLIWKERYQKMEKSQLLLWY